MSFPADLAATLSGNSTAQLYKWRVSGLLIPEIRGDRPPIYSFRDVVALRAIAFLRARVSLQKIRFAFSSMRELNLTAHPSKYTFFADSKTIAVRDDDGNSIDLVRFPGQMSPFTLADALEPFSNLHGQPVADFFRPRPHLLVTEGRLGGWPTIDGTRVPFDIVAQFLGDDPDEEAFEDLEYFYPGVSREAGADAVAFQAEVSAHRRSS
ncbi:DUF433 domain-containing protein [Sinomonas sp. P47F7]|uniref:DUF433 domain-containing protein n=1 Tax=Sinomonas sp. P47F7 TaxID=3410987 RepID=UPI003BF5B321